MLGFHFYALQPAAADVDAQVIRKIILTYKRKKQANPWCHDDRARSIYIPQTQYIQGVNILPCSIWRWLGQSTCPHHAGRLHPSHHPGRQQTTDNIVDGGYLRVRITPRCYISGVL